MECNWTSSDFDHISASEWKEVCRELDLRLTGRKPELRQRAISYLLSPEGQSRLKHFPPSPLIKRLISKLPLAEAPTPPLHTCLCGRVPDTPELKCVQCGHSQHIACMGRAVRLPQFECPLCQLTQVEPYHRVLSILLPPSQPVDRLEGAVPRRFVFSTEHQQKLQQMKPKCLLQIRCIRLDEEGFTYHWPKESSVLLNGRVISSFTQPPSASSRKRKDTAVTLTGLATGEQQLLVLRQRDEAFYAYGVFLVEVLTVEAVTANIVVKESNSGQSFVRSKVRSSGDVVTSSFRQSLKCPLTRLLPQTPVRGVRCTHVQCFDLVPYVIMQEKAKAVRWHCPICNQLALKLVADEYMQKIVRDAEQSKASLVTFGDEGEVCMLEESSDEGESSSEERLQLNSKRPSSTPSLQPSKKRLLEWSHFQGKAHTGAVLPQDLFDSLPYQNAARKHRKVLIIARGSKDCPILLDD